MKKLGQEENRFMGNTSMMRISYTNMTNLGK